MRVQFSWVEDFVKILYFSHFFRSGIKGFCENSLPSRSNGQKFKYSNVQKSQSQISNVNKVKLLSEGTSGIPPVIFQLLFAFETFASSAI